MDQRTLNAHEGVPNLKPGLSDNTKWFLGFIMAALAFAAGPVVTLIQAPKKDDWQAQRDAITEVQTDIKLLKQAADNQERMEAEREKRRALEYSDLKEAIEKRTRR